MFGAFTYVGADLHLRFGVSFTLVGLFVGAFAIGGLIYSLSVRMLVTRFGQVGLATLGGALLGLAFMTLAIEPRYIAPVAIIAIGLGFYMLHNTLQTNATQMVPEARGTAVAIFSSALYLGQTVGVAVNGVDLRPLHRGAGLPRRGGRAAAVGLCSRARSSAATRASG